MGRSNIIVYKTEQGFQGWTWPAIEKCIRASKERLHATWNMLTLKKIPTRIIIEMVTGISMWINMFPHTDSISTERIPRTLVTVLHINYKRHCLNEFGYYSQTHKENKNIMGSRKIWAIALWEMENYKRKINYLS